MTSWQRVKAYARQRGQDPYGQVTLTWRQARRYMKKWHREFPDLIPADNGEDQHPPRHAAPTPKEPPWPTNTPSP